MTLLSIWKLTPRYQRKSSSHSCVSPLSEFLLTRGPSRNVVTGGHVWCLLGRESNVPKFWDKDVNNRQPGTLSIQRQEEQKKSGGRSESKE